MVDFLKYAIMKLFEDFLNKNLEIIRNVTGKFFPIFEFFSEKSVM
jgi:hypothetical protein